MIWEPGTGQRVPIRVWARAITRETEAQLRRLAGQPWVHGFVAAMADAHVAEGVAVGSVFATTHTVVPRALGGDLGCGMSALRLDVEAGALDRRALVRLVEAFGRAIPTGSATHRGKGALVPDALLAAPLSTHSLEHAREALARRHLGTLGGGNHFLELDRDHDGHVWLLVHSGSRGLGAAVAAHHDHEPSAAAGARDAAMPSLDTRTEAGAAYLADLAWTLDFARANRLALVSRALAVLEDVLGVPVPHAAEVDIHHNFVARETWLGESLLVHRKGAVAVPRGSAALVPGSMGTASYVVLGLGNEESFGSCSHGAGRVMTRREARTAIHPRALAETMRRVVYPERLARDLVEEAPAAYRDIREVLEDQTDLVTRQVRLEPMAVLKG